MRRNWSNGRPSRSPRSRLPRRDEETRYRHAACLLADIGWRAHPEYRGTQSLNIIAHASFIGVDHPGRLFLALVNAFRNDGVFNDAIAPELKALATPRYLERARLLGAMMRVVYLLTASMPGVMPKLKWEKRDNGALALVIPASRAALRGERPEGRMAQLAKVSGRKLELVVSGELTQKNAPARARAFFISRDRTTSCGGRRSNRRRRRRQQERAGRR